MRVMALCIAACALACIGTALWLLLFVAAQYYGSAGYAPHSAAMPGYAAGTVQADGDGIFIPGMLLLAVGVFLGKWALNLWRHL